MSGAIVHDGLPRQLAYPFSRIALEDRLFDLEWPDQLGLYFLYISGKQLDLYDPLLSHESRYPVIVLDNAVPPLNANVLAQIAERQRQEAEQKAQKNRVVEVSGSERAQAQLEGAESPGHRVRVELAEPVLPPESLIVLPVKARMRRRVTEAFETRGLRPIKNWLACPRERKSTQRPLVLLFDEETDRVVAKFADEPSDRSARRLYS